MGPACRAIAMGAGLAFAVSVGAREARGQDAPAPETGAAGAVAAARRPAVKAPPAASAARRSVPARTAAPDALLPGFEMLADGSTRLFVELSRPVEYETKAARDTITYVLKGARVERRNNENPLVTVHFNTPVVSARLVTHGRDLWFVVSLRASVTPAVTMDAGKDGSALLRIEFPKGNYVAGGGADRTSETSGDGSSVASAQAPGRTPRATAASDR